jgi:putative spermidine/putrescine transport system ATP-binding protein
MSTGVSVRLRACSKSFGDSPVVTRVLNPLDLEIHAGETVVLLGPSGCGKTTTLRLIGGLDFPDTGGQVFFDQEDVTSLPIEKRNVGMVFQSYALFPNLTVRGNVEYGLKIHRVPEPQRRKRVDELLALTELTAFADRRVDQLSGGQRQRVALARAIAPRPRVLLLDEPLTALDARLRELLRTEISALLRVLGTTAVYVTHDQAEAMAIGDRVAVMHQGSLVQIATPKTLYFEPATDFVADFIGTSNFLTIAGSRLIVRPEDVSCADSPNAYPTPSDGQGTVSNVVFLGDHARLTATLNDGQTVVVKAAARAHFVVGQRVFLWFRPFHLGANIVNRSA